MPQLSLDYRPTQAGRLGPTGTYIDVYLQSIDAADADMATKVWSTTPQVSFIHPLGHERGWDQIKTNFYGKVLEGRLKDRHLKLVGDPAIHVCGKSAIVEFYWELRRHYKGKRRACARRWQETRVYEHVAGMG
ncbi:hypothetical protein [Bradyrhizobium liaoningense]